MFQKKERNGMNAHDYVVDLSSVRLGDVSQVGGKNASLGEMMAALQEEGVKVPPGFAVTTAGYWNFLEESGCLVKIEGLLSRIVAGDPFSLQKGSEAIRELLLLSSLPSPLKDAILSAHRDLKKELGENNPLLAVRSSATAEDLPEASFAGQQESFLNIVGEEALLDAVHHCFVSLFTDRAICYRREKGFADMEVALSVGVQQMVRSDQGSAGILFTIDPDSGFDKMMVINGIWGLGELIVQGSVTPDEYMVYSPFLCDREKYPIVSRNRGEQKEKQIIMEGAIHRVGLDPEEESRWTLSDDEVLFLARAGQAIATHYGSAMDIEWAKDGKGVIYIVQARPETIHRHKKEKGASITLDYLSTDASPLVTGIAVGQKVAVGQPQVIEKSKEIATFRKGGILVTEMTDPDWVPIMKQAAGIVTNQGGRTSHAAIVSRELGIPAIVGTGRGTDLLSDKREITLSCAEGERGKVYEGVIPYQRELIEGDFPEAPVDLMLNLATPSTALRWSNLPTLGVGLMRIEFIISESIQMHPMALLKPDRLSDRERHKMAELTKRYASGVEYFIEQLSLAMAKIAAVHFPHPAIVRMSDFKTNEYANLIGGHVFETEEKNPMLGFRGASRYTHPDYAEAFALECRAVKRARERMGCTNLIPMIPFCRTPEEGIRVIEVM
ncbi:MAG: phosphoenolpyruvate synthase, partial [Chlamydiota bacterium]|nr:phosphoenolpyruvate synthase [Chlamydiota bacterium]